MRDKRFVAEHRGGPLKKEQHIQLIQWACLCAENVLPLLDEPIDARIHHALHVARAWAIGKATTGDAMNASASVHVVARELVNSVSVAVARAVGHTVATAHMADHALGGAMYALKAVKNAGQSIEVERKWQNDQLSIEIRELVLTARIDKEKTMKL